jgi:hypothetical protein
MDREKLRLNKEKVLASLIPEQVKTLQKDNPFRSERNQMISDLRGGVLHRAIAEISGLGVTQENNIAGKMPRNIRERIRADIETYLDDLLSKLESQVKRERR